MKIKLLPLLIVLVLAGCDRIDVPSDVPECIVARIEFMNKRNPPLSFCKSGGYVKEYLYKGQKVYAFDPGNCFSDFGFDLYDSFCNYLGNVGSGPGTGFINIINGDTAFNATYIRTIWKN